MKFVDDDDDDEMYENLLNFRTFKEIGVEEHNGDIIYWTESRVYRACAIKNMQYNRYLLLNYTTRRQSVFINAIVYLFCLFRCGYPVPC